MRYATSWTLFAPVLLALCVSPASGQSEGMPWRTDFQAALAEAQQSGKLVLAHFWTETCGPCKLLESRVFSQPQVAMAVQTNYIPVKINANEAPEIAEAYGVTRVPTDVVVSSDGKLVKAFISPAAPMEYIGATSRLAAAYHAQADAYSGALASAPVPPMGYDPSQQPNYAQFASQNSAPAPQPSVPAAVASNPYASAPQAPITPIQEPAPTTPSAPSVADASPQLPPGSPALGFEGYCPVTMKNEWRWAKGDVRWGAIHRGRTYLFASDQAQKTFLADPDAYSPVLSGADAVAAVDQRRSVPGVREFAVEFEGRFYMFSSEQSLEKFWSNPNGYAKGVDRVAALPAESSFIR